MISEPLADLVERELAQGANQSFPESTYRLQFHAGFTFRDAISVVPYLRELGITHVYASPFLKARSGSTHGYDIVDHRSLNPEIGTDEDFNSFVDSLWQHDLRLIIDIVPNHMGIASDENLWWSDVLENGPSSPFAGYFDIAWNDNARPELKQKVLLPVLGEPYGQALEAGQLKLSYEEGKFTLWYFDRRLPIAPRSYSLILNHRIEELGQRLGADSPEFAEYQSILVAIGHLPDRCETDVVQVAVRQREKEIVKRRLGELTTRNEVVREFIQENVAAFNGVKGISKSFDLLDDLLSHQCYRLSFWRVALEEINYRRFFDVNELAAISVERKEVFNAVHELIFRSIAEGKVHGLRVDHPDGLYDPRQYFCRLQLHYLLDRIRTSLDPASPQTKAPNQVEDANVLTDQLEKYLDQESETAIRWPLYVVAEKILGADEQVPSDWAIHGTCGYEFVRAANSLFVDEQTEVEFTRLYREVNANYTPFPDLLYRSKRLILS